MFGEISNERDFLKLQMIWKLILLTSVYWLTDWLKFYRIYFFKKALFRNWCSFASIKTRLLGDMLKKLKDILQKLRIRLKWLVIKKFNFSVGFPSSVQDCFWFIPRTFKRRLFRFKFIYLSLFDWNHAKICEKGQILNLKSGDSGV